MKVFLGLVVLMLAVVGCGGGDSGPSVNVTGTWRANVSNGDVYTTGLQQDANGVVTGNVGNIPVTGSVDGSHITMLGAPAPDIILTIEGDVEGQSASGTYEVRGPDINESGTWTATKL